MLVPVGYHAMTKKEIDKVRGEAATELYGVLIVLDYAIEDLELFRDDVRETAKYVTKEIGSARKKLNKMVKKWEEVSGRKYNPKGKK